jgi:methylenetetrahydrofolate reductase (NADPH)
MRIRELLSMGRPSFSFEFFPPKTDAGRTHLLDTVAALRDLSPTYVSVTYGAGGSTREQTVDLVARIKRDHGIETMAHLTCVGSSRDELDAILRRLQTAGIDNVLALRGDPPKGETEFRPAPDGFAYANELTAFIRSRFPFCVVGACYPEKHVECASPELDLANLVRKVEAGAEVLVSQLFFDNRHYFDFVARARRAGIGVPIVPGIMPITNVEQVERFTKMCGATIPEPLLSELRKLADRPEAVLSLGVAHATAQCFELLEKGAPGIHFYTLNKSSATRTILTALRTVWPPARNPA